MIPPRIAEAWMHREARRIAAEVESTRRLETLPITLAGVDIDLVFAGAAIRDALAPALEHARRDSAASEVDADRPWRVLAWDSSAGPAIPRPPTDLGFHDNGELTGLGRDKWRTSFHFGDHTVALLDLQARTGLLWVEDAADVPAWSRAAPCRALLSWILGAEGRTLIHGAAIGDPRTGRGLLVVGAGGSGKSTTVALAVRAGLTTCGDDYVALSWVDGRVRAHALFSRTKLVDAERATRPQHWTRREATPDGKQVYDVGDGPGWVASIDVDLVAVATRPGTVTTSAATIAKSEAFAAAAVPTTQQLSYWRRDADLWAMVTAVPAVRLGLGGRDGVASGVRSLLAGALPVRPAAALPPVSVVIPMHNGAQFLPDAVASVRAQDCGEVEIVVVDDASDSDPSALCRELGVRLVRLAHNGGPAAARNAGVAAASHDLIGFLDVDDRWTPYSLTPRVLALANAPDAVVVRGTARLVGPDGREIWLPGKADFPCYIGTGLFRRRAFDTVGPFCADLRFGEDIDWFLRLRESGLAHLSLPLLTLEVLRHGGNATEGRDLVQLGVLQVARLAMERRRSRA